MTAEPTRPAPRSAADGAFRAALRDLLVFLAVIAVLGSLLGFLVAGLPGVWSVLLGAAVVLVFCGTTIVSMTRTAGASPTAFAATVMGLWLGKFAVVLVAILVLRPLDFYDKPVFGITVVLGAIGAMVLDMRAVRRARVPYLEPSEPGHGQEDPSA